MSTDRPRVEFDLPGTTTEDLRIWARNVECENPVSIGFDPWAPDVRLLVTDEPFGGVELTFLAGTRPVFTLAIFATHLTEEEKQMEDSDE